MNKVIIELKHITQYFPGVVALDNMSFTIREGMVHGLIGENGAGKSTLIKVLTGINHPSKGQILIDGKEVKIADPQVSRAYGIGCIYQELNICPDLSVTDNLFINSYLKKGFLLNYREMNRLAEKTMADLGQKIDPGTLCGQLGLGVQQAVEIGKAVLSNSRLIIMDEPTSSLSNQEVKVLFGIMRELTEAGISIVYISHRLEEIMEIGDHVTILRDGHYVADADVKDIQLSWIVTNMVGENKSYTRTPRSIDLKKQPVELKVENLCLPKKGGGWLLHDISFEVKKGEIFGIYGLLGAGRSELMECIMGLRPEHTGEVYLEGKKLRIGQTAEQIKRGLAIVPEDRQGAGLVQTMDIEKNTSLSNLKKYAKRLLLSQKAEDEDVDKVIDEIHIKVADKKLPILSLSGGNQQKVVIGKGLLTGPKILLMDEPSRGIDIGAKTEVFDIIHQFADQGLTILVVSSELKEIMNIADRIMVLSNGVKTAEFTAGEGLTEDDLVLASYAGHHTDADADAEATA